jgi:hypothetical protein
LDISKADIPVPFPGFSDFFSFPTEELPPYTLGYWWDYSLGGSTEVRVATSVTGEAPFRQFTVRWDSFVHSPEYTDFVFGSYVTLDETTGKFSIHESMSPGQSFTDGVVGLQGEGVGWSVVQNFRSATPLAFDNFGFHFTPT